jgi:predicted nucleic acid-binding protein
MNLLFDTNVVLDVLLYRQPWVQDAQKLWQAHEDGLLTGYLTATTFTGIFYIAKRQ